ncbi:MAG: NAD(P)-dependent oxidoreductase [Micromonosporaceae bacterium]|nr:NAD(P)-dependent oxidoreductase [Micromonosporaceae bacterium]
MILITGGLGFIGLNTTRALLDLGEDCVVTQHRNAHRPEFIQKALGSRVFVEPVDFTDLAAVRRLGEQHRITGIVHLLGGLGFGGLPLQQDLRHNTDVLVNLLQVIEEWQVPRVCLASTIGIYIGAAEVPASSVGLREEMPLPPTGTFPIEAWKKVTEILSTLFAARHGFDVVNMRIGAVWGPFGRPDSRFFQLPQMVHAAVRGQPARFDPPAYTMDGGDCCYAKDVGRAIALLQTAPKLNHQTYNVSSGFVTRNCEVADAIRRVVPGADIELAEGRAPGSQDLWLDTSRLVADTGFRPQYDLERGIADYVEWLRAGNER